FFVAKEANRRNVVHAILHHFARLRIPARPLAERAVPRIIARLPSGRNRLAGFGIANPVLALCLAFHHAFFSLRRRLASSPRAPHAENNSGAKIGGPYRML